MWLSRELPTAYGIDDIALSVLWNRSSSGLNSEKNVTLNMYWKSKGRRHQQYHTRKYVRRKVVSRNSPRHVILCWYDIFSIFLKPYWCWKNVEVRRIILYKELTLKLKTLISTSKRLDNIPITHRFPIVLEKWSRFLHLLSNKTVNVSGKFFYLTGQHWKRRDRKHFYSQLNKRNPFWLLSLTFSNKHTVCSVSRKFCIIGWTRTNFGGSWRKMVTT